jgi:yecA family protein
VAAVTRYEAYIHRNFRESGFTPVIITRTDDSGYLQAGVVLLDLYCLGVKNAFLTEMPASDWPEEVDRFIPAADRMSVHPACARKLIEGAVKYAEALGFSPHHDFKKARRAFGSVDAKACAESFTYGKDGKPLYVAGPNDDEAKIDRILAVLTAKVGAEGFHYIVPADPVLAELPAAERLRTFFSEYETGDLSFESLSGLVTALVIRPLPLSDAALVAAIWGEEPPVQISPLDRRQAEKDFCLLLEERASDLSNARESGQLELAVDFDPVEEDSFEEAEWQLQTAIMWCAGFQRALALWPEAWSAALARADLQPAFAVLREYAAMERLHPYPKPKLKAAEYELRVGQAVLALYTALRPPGETVSPSA